MEATLTQKGQATLPKQVRDHLGLKAGDRVRYFIDPDGTVIILPIRPVSALCGILKSGRHVSTGEMDKAIRHRAAERSRRLR